MKEHWAMKILIIKFGARGDVLRTTAVLPSLIKKYENAEIYWLTYQNASQLLVNNPFLSKVFVYGQRTRDSLLKERFDLVINLEEDFEACSLATKVNKRELVGFYLDKKNRIVPTATITEWYNMSALGKKPQNDILKKQNKKTYQQMMLEALNLKPEHHEPFLHLADDQKQFAQDFRRRYNIRDDDTVIGVNTGCGERWASKQLSVKKTAELINQLYRKFHAKIILFGGEQEIERNDRILSFIDVPIVNTGCGNSLREFPALVNLCHVFVTADTLGLHVAVALKRRVVALIGPTSANEIELYNLGKKVVPEDPCVCCYKEDCKSMEKIQILEVIDAVESLLKMSVSIVVASFREPNLKKAIDAVVQNPIKFPAEIIIVSPDKEVEQIVKNYTSSHLPVRWFKDEGLGKSYALNMIFQKVKSDILVLTDGDVTLGDNAINEIISKFRDPIVGCVSGRVVSESPKNTIVGYWSHLLADVGAHRIRKELAAKEKFLECTGYLFAFRNNIIKEIPLHVAEDTIIPAIFWEKGYKIDYAEDAIVYVKNPTTLKGWLKQRRRTAKAHENLNDYINPGYTKRVKSFSNELRKGALWAFTYPKSIKEFTWTIFLFFARFYMWLTVFLDTKVLKKQYHDAWERIESTKGYQRCVLCFEGA